MSPKKFDITLKDLVEHYADAWAELAGPIPPTKVDVISADIATLAAAPDKVLLVHAGLHAKWLINLELQADHELGLPDLMHYKSVALRWHHKLLVHTTIVLLRRKAIASDLTGVLTLQFPNDAQPYDVFRYQIIRLWEFPLKVLLTGSTGLLPLAPLTDDAAHRLPEVLGEIDERIRHEVSLEEAENLRAATFLLMGLRYNPDVVEKLIQEVMHMTLESSSTYQWIIEKGKAQGKAEGKAEGRLEEVRAILLRQGTKKFGTPDSETITQINSITDLDRLELLADSLLVVASWEALLSR